MAKGEERGEREGGTVETCCSGSPGTDAPEFLHVYVNSVMNLLQPRRIAGAHGQTVVLLVCVRFCSVH